MGAGEARNKAKRGGPANCMCKPILYDQDLISNSDGGGGVGASLVFLALSADWKPPSVGKALLRGRLKGQGAEL